MAEAHDSLSADEVRKVARLARLEISEAEVEKYRASLSAVLGYMERLKGLELKGVEPMAHVAWAEGDRENRLRADEPGEALPVSEVMRLAPESTPPFIRVPKVLGEGGGA
jgi:aspartyl-tRNA(Asn)/glutamyl-tRNA(Gln) amidotransferase subunit C